MSPVSGRLSCSIARSRSTIASCGTVVRHAAMATAINIEAAIPDATRERLVAAGFRCPHIIQRPPQPGGEVVARHGARSPEVRTQPVARATRRLVISKTFEQRPDVLGVFTAPVKTEQQITATLVPIAAGQQNLSEMAIDGAVADVASEIDRPP